MATATTAGRITEKELARAEKMAARKQGVTHAQLAEALGINERRARAILQRTKAKASQPGGLGKASRTLVYKA